MIYFYKWLSVSKFVPISFKAIYSERAWEARWTAQILFSYSFAPKHVAPGASIGALEFFTDLGDLESS